MRRAGLCLFFFLPLWGQNNNTSFSGVLEWPVKNNRKYIISSTFGESRLDHFHNGLDIAGEGFSVYPMADGSLIWKNNSYEKMGELPFGGGKTVIIDHRSYWSGYMHLSRLSSDGAVNRDTALGRAGDSGHSGRAHLHFFLYSPVEKRMHNPLLLLPEGFYSNLKKPVSRGYAVKLPEEFVQVDLERSFTMSHDYPIYAKIQDSGSGLERWGVYFLEIFNDDHGNEPTRKVVFDYLQFSNGQWMTSNNLLFSDIYFGSWYNLGSGFRQAQSLRWIAGGYQGPSQEESFKLNIKLE